MMSFISAIVLAANRGVRPSRAEIQTLFVDVGLLHSEHGDAEYSNLASDISDLFADAAAIGENDRFFCPDSIGYFESIEIFAENGVFEEPGWAIHIHGNGYFFPWSLDMLRHRIASSAKLCQLRKEVNIRFGGQFVFPEVDGFIRERWIDGENGWVWFASESM
jgi:hypothetical protein